MLYTGYFARTKSYIKEGIHPVSIAGKTPDFFTYNKWSIFAPRKPLFDAWKSGEISNEEYVSLYKEYLSDTITPVKAEKLKEVISEKDIVMCCYEKSGDFCHRHALAEWLFDMLGIEVKEYGTSSK